MLCPLTYLSCRGNEARDTPLPPPAEPNPFVFNLLNIAVLPGEIRLTIHGAAVLWNQPLA